MKNWIIVFAVFVTSFSSFAQQGALDDKWLGYMIETERRAVFQEGMILTDVNRDAFWAIYDEYEQGLETTRKQSLDYLKRYAAEYETMTDEQAMELTKMGQNNQLQRIMLQRKYSKRIGKEIGGKVAARFVQIDNAVSMLLRLQVMDEIPMVGDIN